MRSQIKGTLILLLAALIWGCAFVAQSSAAETVGPFTVMTIRSFIGGTALIPVYLITRKLRRTEPSDAPSVKYTLLGGAVCGAVLCTASVLQQAGLATTSPGKGGFITSMYILGVPILGIFLGRRASLRTWLSVAGGAVGLFLLCCAGSGEGFVPAGGDVLVILSAVGFSFHIMAVDRFAEKINGVLLAMMQFFFAGAVAAVPALIFERGTFAAVGGAIGPILYLGLMSTGVAYTLQIIGQKYCAPAVASLAMSFESVFAVAGEMVVYGLIMRRPVSMSVWEAVGCVVMFVSVAVASLPEKERAEK